MRIAWRSRTVDPGVASFRYRVLKPIEALSERGHAAEIYVEEHFDSYDKVVFSKAYQERDQSLARRLRDAGKEVILDLCDNHFYNPSGLATYAQVRKDLLAMIGLSSSVVCSTPALARVVRQEAGRGQLPEVVGDMFEEPANVAGRPAGGLPRLVWFGLHGSPNAPAGMADILKIADTLASLNARTPFELVVASNSRAKFDELIAPLRFRSRYVEWTPDGFAMELAAARAVILPLSDNPFVACKTHNRLSLALAAGVPVVADAIESYREFAPFCYLGDWTGGLAAVLTDPAASRRRAARALRYLETYWSVDAMARGWETVLGLSGRALAQLGAAAGIDTRPAGELRISPAGHVIGWVHDPRQPQRTLEVELTVNGKAWAVTPADMPAVRRDHTGAKPSRRGGFIFPRDVLAASREPLLRCTLGLSGTGEPIVNAMLDLHRPQLEAA